MGEMSGEIARATSRAAAHPPGKRILMVIGHYHPIVGGAERQAKKLAERMQALGHCVEVLAVHTWGLPIRERINGILVRRIAFYSFGAIKLILSRAVVFLFVLIRGRSYTCVHVHGGNDLAVAAVAACRMIGAPSVVKMVNSADWFDLRMMSRRSAFWGRCAGMLAKHAGRFVATTPQIIQDLREFGVPEGRISLIPNGTEIRRGARDASRWGAALEIVMVGRLVKEKNAGFLIGVLSSARFPFRLAIYGEGPDRKSLERRISHLGLDNRVLLAGTVESEALHGALSACDLFVLPSIVEGLSNALLEAMSAGAAILVSDLPSNRFVLGDGLAEECILPLDPELWLRRLERLSGDSAKLAAIGAAARERVKFFGIEAIADRYLELYGELSGAP